MTSVFADILHAADAPSAPAPEGSTRVDSAGQRLRRRTQAAQNAREHGATITAGHRMAFNWLRSNDGDFGLVSCHVNGHPSALVVAAQPHGDAIEIMPLFVALTDGMRITGPDGTVVYENGGVA